MMAPPDDVFTTPVLGLSNPAIIVGDAEELNRREETVRMEVSFCEKNNKMSIFL